LSDREMIRAHISKTYRNFAEMCRLMLWSTECFALFFRVLVVEHAK